MAASKSKQIILIEPNGTISFPIIIDQNLKSIFPGLRDGIPIYVDNYKLAMMYNDIFTPEMEHNELATEMANSLQMDEYDGPKQNLRGKVILIDDEISLTSDDWINIKREYIRNSSFLNNSIDFIYFTTDGISKEGKVEVKDNNEYDWPNCQLKLTKEDINNLFLKHHNPEFESSEMAMMAEAMKLKEMCRMAKRHETEAKIAISFNFVSGRRLGTPITVKDDDTGLMEEIRKVKYPLVPDDLIETKLLGFNDSYCKMFHSRSSSIFHGEATMFYKFYSDPRKIKINFIPIRGNVFIVGTKERPIDLLKWKILHCGFRIDIGEKLPKYIKRYGKDAEDLCKDNF